jgi:diguanylate cyclase (GGDEF)-like protein
MPNAASTIEKIIELTLTLNNDIADKEAYIKVLEDKLSILNTLKEVNYYMGAELELKNVIQIITDVVMGVLGVSACSICLKRDNTWDIMEHSILEKNRSIINSLTIDYLEEELNNRNREIVIHDLKLSEFMHLKEGSFIALSLTRGTVIYGVITIYYIQAGSLNEGKLEFFKLISAQLGVHLENAFLYEKVKLASITDGLTGLYNRLYLNETLHKNKSLNTSEFAFIMIDIDNFKKVNDTYGHIFGDTVIKTLAGILKQAEKKYNITAYRYGGEEFLILCNNLSLEILSKIADEIRISFFNHVYKIDEDKTTNFSISLGLSKSGYSSKINDITQLINAADEALYFSKKSGKNRYSVSSGNLQLYMKSIETIDKMVARFLRFKKQFMLYKINIELTGEMAKAGYNKIIEAVNKSFRLYDTVFISNTGEFVGVLESKIEKYLIQKRLLKNLREYSVNNIIIDSFLYSNDNSDIEAFFNLPKGFKK